MPRPVVVAIGRAGDAQVWKRAEPEYETGIEHEVDQIREPQHTHGDRGIAGAAEDGVHEEQHQNGATATERDPRVETAHRDDGRAAAHEREQLWGEHRAGGSEHQGDEQPERDGLARGVGGTVAIVFSDPAGDERGRPHAETEGGRVEQGQH